MNPEHKKYIIENMYKKSAARIASELGVRERRVKKIIEMEREKGIPRRAVPQERPPKIAGTPIGKTFVFVSVMLIVILGLAVYANSLNGKFVYDDENLVMKNTFIKSWSNLTKIFTEDIGKASGKRYSFYRPIQMVTYAIDYQIWHLNVIGYHLTNVILHILVALCVYWLISILFEDKTVSVLTAALFVTHPIHTTVASYISTRADSLYLLFLLVSFVFYIKSIRNKNVIFFILMMSSYLLSILSKENALIFPALLLLYHYAFKEKIRIRGFVSVSGIALLYIVLRMTILKHLIAGAVVKDSLLDRIPGFFVAIATYIRLLFFPLGLHLEYGTKLFNFTDPKAIAGLVMFGGLIFCVIKTIKTNRLISFSLSWFIITLFPVSNLFPLNAYMSESWLYLPSVGFFMLLAGFLKVLYKKEKVRMLIIVFTVCLLAIYSYLTIMQNRTWADPILFYERTLKYAPDSPKVYNNLANLYHDLGRRDEVVSMYRKAIELNPNDAESYSNLGNIYDEMNRKEEAVSMHKKAIEISPDYANAYYNLGNVYYNNGNVDEAVSLYKKAIELNPNYADAYNNLGIAYCKTGKKEEALPIYKKAIGLNPDNIKFYYNLGIAYYETEKKKDAIAMYQKVVKINPGYAPAYNNLANIYSEMGKKEEAIAIYKKAIDIAPGYANAYYNLGTEYSAAGKKEEAITMYKKATELNPNNASYFNSLGIAYLNMGRRDDAVAAFRKALEINPDHAEARRNLEAIEKRPK